MIFSVKNLSLRIRIFLAMILLIVLASVLIATVTIFQYGEQTNDYNIKRFGRKEDAVKKRIDLELHSKTTYLVSAKNLEHIFQELIFEIASVHKVNISMYTTQGALLKTSIPIAFEKSKKANLTPEIVSELGNSSNHRVLKIHQENGVSYQSSYMYLKDEKFKRIGILQLQITQNNTEQKEELAEFMYRLGIVYLFMFVIAIALAYFLSSYITRSIKTISDKMSETGLNKRNEKIILASASSEIDSLVNAYNSMIDQLEESAVKLAQSEREQAWREMAKQVAHEIKNPLTPMRLTVQSFERKFSPEDPKIIEKVKEYSQILIQQIDVMSSIASAFSDFAKMPTPKKEQINVVEVVKLAIDIFNEEYIYMLSDEKEINGYLDKTQLIRIVTNLVKNATQAIESVEHPKIEVKVVTINNNIIITVSDNGKGVTEENKARVFEPKFTTKTSGMGLGLPMIKKIIEAYNGSIGFTSKENFGTVFTVTIPKK